MTILRAVSMVLGKSRDAEHMHDLLRLSDEVLSDPESKEKAGILHDALQDAGVSVDPSRHPAHWPGWGFDDMGSHPQFAMQHAYNAANQHSLHSKLDEQYQKIAAEPHEAVHKREASLIADEHGAHDLADSFRYASRNNLQPRRSASGDGTYLWVNTANTGLTHAVDSSFGLDQAQFNHLIDAHESMYPDEPNATHVHGNGVAYFDNHKDAWNAFHRAHAAWSVDGGE